MPSKEKAKENDCTKCNDYRKLECIYKDYCKKKNLIIAKIYRHCTDFKKIQGRNE